MSRPVAAFFDLDKTIIAKSSALAFTREFQAGGLITRRAMLRSAYAQFVFFIGGADHDQMDKMRQFMSQLVIGWDVATVREIVTDTLLNTMEPLVFDEAQFGLAMRQGSVRAAGIEYLRDIAERAGSYALLVCHNSEVAGFSESQHIRTRIAHRGELYDAGEADTAAFVRYLCEVPVAAEVAQIVHRQTGGKFRLVENAIAALERIGAIKGLARLEAADVGHVTLVVDHEKGLVPKVAAKKKERPALTPVPSPGGRGGEAGSVK